MESDTTGHWQWEQSVKNGSSMSHLQDKLLAASCLHRCTRTSIQDEPGRKNELLSQSPSACSSYSHSSLASPALLPCVYVKPKFMLR